jgi:hypothetical protein
MGHSGITVSPSTTYSSSCCRASLRHIQAILGHTRLRSTQRVAPYPRGANGDTIEDLLDAYPAITREDILACLAHAGDLADEARGGE